MSGSIRLVQITDLHLRTPPGDIMSSGVNTDESLQSVLDAACEDIRQSDLVVASGDLVHEPDLKSYMRLKEKLDPCCSAVRFIAGNHDDPEMMKASLDGGDFAVGGDMRLGKWQLLFLDTSAVNMVGGELAKVELERLESVLADSEAEHAMIFLHHHPLPVSSDWMDAIALENADAFFSVIDRYAFVRAAAFGHIHQEFEARRAGVSYFGTPSTCVQFRPRTVTSELDSLPPAWRLFDLFDDGSIRSEVRYLPA